MLRRRQTGRSIYKSWQLHRREMGGTGGRRGGVSADPFPSPWEAHIRMEVDRDSDGHVSFKDFELAVRRGRDNL
ncbi:hypothetical protein COCON_G00016620 [Conger conger]|uniref:EF-hand domain-containing protein n=1 Tax=Conger conger TaxID=82655 RepID=A0A9Q1I9M9_CONCO|nr:hypothetical protein COCON_G00016620 [Conger conger]